MLTLDTFRNVESVLCIGAHSDDIEIGCGGTLLRLVKENPDLAVHWVVLSASNERRLEAMRSADAFLVGASQKQVFVKNFEERFFPSQSQEIKRYLDGLGASIHPNLILTHFRDDLHQDHRLIGELTWQTFRNHLILEYEIPKFDQDLAHPNMFVDLEWATCIQKVESILDHFPSQRQRYWFNDETFWAMLRIRGVEARSTTGYAEAFHARKLVLS